MSGNVRTVEGLGFAVHHVLFGALELDVGVVRVFEGTFCELGEDAVGAFGGAKEVD